MVIGNAGGGKSTLCSVLCARYSLPYHSIDKLQWQPGWQQTRSVDYNREHDNLIDQHLWLLDGYGSWESVLKRMDVADTIIVVDHPVWIHYWWATKRQLKSLFTNQTDAPTGCSRLPVTFRLFKMMWWLHRVQRPILLQEAANRSHKKRYIHISSPSHLNRFTANPV